MIVTFAIRLDAPDDLDGFRHGARSLIAANAPPESVLWSIAGEDALFDAAPPLSDTPLMLPADFLPLARDVIRHSDPQRFALLYACIWRMAHGERRLLSDPADALVHTLTRMAKSVRRDLHKMTAFVRFRLLRDDGAERYVAWFEPDHHILKPAAVFFRDRFASMHWSILTPKGALHWNGSVLESGPPVPKAEAPQGDALEEWWRTYYRATFNPARTNPRLMQAEMPRKYWHNLPEAPLIPALIDEADRRTRQMLAAPATVPRPARPAPSLAPSYPADSLQATRAEAMACERCPLHVGATQTVFGEGPEDAPVVFVGEQPGDEEDLAGRPFVGPAGQMFDRALAEAGLDRSRAYVTNAVKHFKFTLRGKRRIHQKPNSSEIARCRWWLDKELSLIAPQLTVALGATAARALTGREVTVSRVRGQIIDLPGARYGLITVHPSYLLRLPDRAAQAEEYRRFVDDLRLVGRHVPALCRAA
jgi:probable DNA metabolism protein